MAIKHSFTILCDNIIKSDQGRMSLIDVMANIKIPTIPGGILRLFVVVGLTGKPGDDYRIIVATPSGKVLHDTGPERIESSSDAKRGKYHEMQRVQFFGFAPFVIEEEGMYSVSLTQGKKLIHKHLWGVSLARQEDGNA